MSGLRPVHRDDLLALPVEVAPRLLDARLTTIVEGERVVVRITEVEAYHGLGTGPIADPGSHARSGPSRRNATMWGDAGRLYVYLSHGIHSCVNVVCGPEGVAGGILLRAGEIVEGAEIAERRRLERRGSVPAARDLARGPGRLGDAIGLRHALHDGIDILGGEPRGSAVAVLHVPQVAVEPVARGPRVGVAGVAGTAQFAWRFWIPGDPTVSAFRWGRGAREAAAALGQAATPSVLD